MADSVIGVAVIGAGMAGRAHAAGYRSAGTLYETQLPPVELVAIADVNADFANDAATRFGYTRAETSWQAVADAPDVTSSRRRRQPVAPGDRRRIAGRRKARPLREATGFERQRRRGDGCGSEHV